MMLTLIYIILLVGVFMAAGTIGEIASIIFAPESRHSGETGCIVGGMALIVCLVYLAVKFNPLGIS